MHISLYFDVSTLCIEKSLKMGTSHDWQRVASPLGARFFQRSLAIVAQNVSALVPSVSDTVDDIAEAQGDQAAHRTASSNGDNDKHPTDGHVRHLVLRANSRRILPPSSATFQMRSVAKRARAVPEPSVSSRAETSGSMDLDEEHAGKRRNTRGGISFVPQPVRAGNL